LDRRQQTSTICPSEVARALTASDPAKDWRTAMPAVHAAIDQLMAEGAVQLSLRSTLLRGYLLIEDTIMGLFSKDIVTFDDLFLHQLQDVYYAENQITKALPKMVDKATAPALKQSFETHLRETDEQIVRLERIFELLGEKAKAVTCPAIDGIIKEANEVAGEIEDKAVLDAALIASAQAVEHYEITRYGTLIAWANQLGRTDIAAILKVTLDEEYATDDKLTTMATSSVNAKAEAVTA